MSKVIKLNGMMHVYGPDLSKAPKEVVYIGRANHMGGWALKESKWANPFPLSKYKLEESLFMYENYIREKAYDWSELKGKTLACWCHNSETPWKERMCHGDILAQIVAKLP